MGNPGAQHELVCTLVHKYPSLMLRLAEVAGVRLPGHDQVLAAPNTHQMPDGPPIESDGTVHLLRGGKPVFFAQLEMQRRYGLGKYATLRAYHGSEVRKTKAGGHMFVVSPKRAETGKFRDSDGLRGEEYAYRGSYLSGADLEPLAGKDRPFEERSLAAAVFDFSEGRSAAVRPMLEEMLEQDATIANLYFRTIMEEVPDMAILEDLMQTDMFDRLRQFPAFQNYEAQVRAEAKAEADAKVKAEAEAKMAAAEAEAEAKAKVEATADSLIQFFTVRGDTPSGHVLTQIRACRDVAVLSVCLTRAYMGEEAAEIFPEPEESGR